MNAIKQWFSDMWARVLVLGVALVAILAWVIDLMSKKNNALQAQVQDLKDQKQADVLESQINEKLSDANLKQKEVDNNQAALAQLEEKRKGLPQQQNLSAQQVEQYWKK